MNRAPLPEPDFTLDGDTTACYYAETVTRLLAAAQPQPEAAALTDKQIALEIEAAMRRSFSMGQTYCAQADSDSWEQNKKSNETLAKFNSYIEEVRAVLAAKGKP